MTPWYDWLALINCAASSPAVCIAVRQNFLLLSSNSQPKPVNSIGPGTDMSSPLPRYHNANIRYAHWSMSHRFLEKYFGANPEKGSLKTQCSLISDRTAVGSPKVRCSYQPCNVPESLLLKAGNNSALSLRCHWPACLCTVYCIWTDKNIPLWFLQRWFMGISQRAT